MNCFPSLEEIKMMCRICLTQSDRMISLDRKLDDRDEESPLILEALEKVLSANLKEDVNFPREVCLMCYGQIRLSYDFIQIFNKSQSVLEKYISCHSLCFTEDNIFDMEDDHITIIDTKFDAENELKTSDAEDANIPKKIIKLQLGTNEKKKNVKVKWIEGNKFIVEKKIPPKYVTKCLYCHKRFMSKEKLKEHLTLCKKYVREKCDFCSRTFPSLASKKYHIKLRHSDEAPRFKCDICNQVFKTSNARGYHKLTRHNAEGKKYSCEICGKAFFIKNSLSQHLEIHNKDVSKVVCPICGKSFHYRGGLFYHMKVHRNERNYVCSFCSRRFLNMASLKRHTRTHTGERPYSCSFCAKTFCSMSEVKTHERRHTGYKPYQCKYCQKCFISPYNLKLHASSHSGDRPCDFCEKSFLNNDVLKLHMDVKHNIKDRPKTEPVEKDTDTINLIREEHF